LALPEKRGGEKKGKRPSTLAPKKKVVDPSPYRLFRKNLYSNCKRRKGEGKGKDLRAWEEKRVKTSFVWRAAKKKGAVFAW